jgi:hypothetical protein
MDATYVTRVGVRCRKRAVKRYEQLIALPYREQADDGVIAGPWVLGLDCRWNWDEGSCPCGGVLRWAELGYRPWHRICDRCGSHWDLHVMNVAIWPIPPRAPYLLVPRHAPRPGEWWCDVPSVERTIARCDRCGEVDLREVDLRETPRDCGCGGTWRAVTGRLQYVPAEQWPMVRHIPRLLTPDVVEAAYLRHGVIYAGWARRARFAP